MTTRQEAISRQIICKIFEDFSWRTVVKVEWVVEIEEYAVFPVFVSFRNKIDIIVYNIHYNHTPFWNLD